MKTKLSALVVLCGGFLTALGCNVIPNLGSTFDLSSIFGA
ncbi:MAG: hypothetical protein CHACPFDD_00806 [Phycisphaerae bacterium]|nr:hypothetical protein [Phycisphaerae bacterium]